MKFVWVVVAVIVGSIIAAGVFSYSQSQPSSSIYSYVKNGATISGGNCLESFSNGLPISEYSQNRSIVFFMKPNSTARICVSYLVQKADLASSVTYPIFQYGIRTEHVQCTSNSCVGTGGPANLTMSATPSGITVYPGNTISRVIVVYTINSGVNSTGFYSLSYLNSCTNDIPFAVGYGPSQVNESDFYGFFVPSFGCGGPHYIGYQDYLSNGNVTGISDLTYVYIPVDFSGA